MQTHWKYRTNNHCYFSQMCCADRLFNINRIMCVLTFSNCLVTFRTEHFIMPLVLQYSFQKILLAWNKCMTLDFLLRRLQTCLPFKEPFPMFKSDRNFRQTCKYILTLIPICMYQTIALIRLEWRLTKFWRGWKKSYFFMLSFRKLYVSNIQKSPI